MYNRKTKEPKMRLSSTVYLLSTLLTTTLLLANSNASQETLPSIPSSATEIKLLQPPTDSSDNNVIVSETANVECNTIKIKTITLIAPQTNYERELSFYAMNDKGKIIKYYASVPVPMQVFATFEDGHKEEITDKVEWIVQNNAKVAYSDIILTKEGKATVKAKYQNITSNTVKLTLENHETKSKNLIKYTIYDSNTPDHSADIRIGLSSKPSLVPQL